MAAPTTLPDFDYNFTELGSQTAPILAESSLSGSHAIVLASAWPGDTTKAVILGARTPAGKYMQLYVAAGGFSDTTHATITTRPMKRNTSDLALEDTTNDFDLPTGTKIFPVVASFYLRYLSQAGLGTISSKIKHAGRETFDNAIPNAAPVYATLAAGTAAITPANGDSFYATAEGQFYDYVGGAWTARASGVNPNGSTTVAGKFEEATVAEQGTATATGGSGARLVPANANLVKTSSGAGDENKIAILDASGKFASGFISVATTLTAGENLTAGDLSYVESDGKAWKTKRSTSAFATLAGSATTDLWMNALKLSNGTVIAVSSTGINAVASVSTIAQTTATSGSITTLASNAGNVRAVVIGTNKFATSYESTADNKVYGVVCTVSGTTITVGTPVKLYDTETVNPNTIDICKLDTDKFLVTFSNLTSDDPIAVACTVAGTAITAGTAVQVEAVTTALATTCGQMTTNAAIIFYDDGTNVSCKFLTVSGTTITVASPATDLYAGSIDIENGNAGVIVLDTRNILFWNWVSGAGIRISRLRAMESTYTTAPQYNSTSDTYLQTGATSIASLFNCGKDIFGLLFRNQNADPEFEQYEMSDNAFRKIYSSGAISALSLTSGGLAGVAHTSNKNQIFLVAGNYGATKYSVFMDTSNEFIGVVQTTTASAGSAPIITSQNATISGLTAGTAYYVGDAGAVATTGERLIGVATTTTNLYLK